jgi:hypothetical protein
VGSRSREPEGVTARWGPKEVRGKTPERGDHEPGTEVVWSGDAARITAMDRVVVLTVNALSPGDLHARRSSSRRRGAGERGEAAVARTWRRSAAGLDGGDPKPPAHWLEDALERTNIQRALHLIEPKGGHGINGMTIAALRPIRARLGPPSSRRYHRELPATCGPTGGDREAARGKSLRSLAERDAGSEMGGEPRMLTYGSGCVRRRLGQPALRSRFS